MCRNLRYRPWLLIVNLQSLINKLSTTDYQVNNGVLQTAHSIFKPWRSQFRTDSLFIEIKYVLDKFCDPYKQLFAVSGFTRFEKVHYWLGNSRNTYAYALQ
jgi:hypothetical protein